MAAEQAATEDELLDRIDRAKLRFDVDIAAKPEAIQWLKEQPITPYRLVFYNAGKVQIQFNDINLAIEFKLRFC